MPDRLYGGIRAGRTGLSLAVLLRRDDTGKGKTAVVVSSVPVLGTWLTYEVVTPASPAHAYTTGPGETYLLVQVSSTSGNGGTEGHLTAMSFGAAPLTRLAEIGVFRKHAEMWGGVVPASTTDTLTMTFAVQWNVAIAVVGVRGVGTVGTVKTATMNAGSTLSVTLDAADVGPTTLGVDLLAMHALDPSGTPVAGQSVSYAALVDGGNQTKLQGSWAVNHAGFGWTGLSAANADVAMAAVPLIGATTPPPVVAYARHGAVPVAVSLTALGSPADAWTAGGWVELDAVKQPGLYRLDVPDAACAAGADWLTVSVVCPGAIEYHERLALETRRSLRGGGAYPGLTFLLQKASDGTALTGASVTGQRILDGGTPAALTNAVVELSGGLYKVDLAAADTAAVFGCYLFTATGAIPRAVLLTFEP